MAPLSPAEKMRIQRARETEKKRQRAESQSSIDADRITHHQNAACKSKGKRTIEGETLSGLETNIRATRGAFFLRLVRHMLAAIKKAYSPQGPQKLRERRVIDERSLQHWSRL